MPSVNVKDVQQEGKRAPPTPLTHSREREFLREGSDKAEHEMADNQGFCGLTNLSELLACLALAALLSFWDQGQCALSKGRGGASQAAQAAWAPTDPRGTWEGRGRQRNGLSEARLQNQPNFESQKSSLGTGVFFQSWLLACVVWLVRF